MKNFSFMKFDQKEHDQFKIFLLIKKYLHFEMQRCRFYKVRKQKFFLSKLELEADDPRLFPTK